MQKTFDSAKAVGSVCVRLNLIKYELELHMKLHSFLKIIENKSGHTNKLKIVIPCVRNNESVQAT